MASPKSHTVSPLALCSLTVRAPSLATAVTQKAAAENGKAWDSCDKPLAFTRANEAGGRLWRPSALCCISGFVFFFFFPLLLQTALNFLLDLISSVKKCHPKGPAEMLSGPAPLKKANNLFAHKEWKKMFLCFKDYWTPSFQNESVPSSRDNFH